MMRYPTIMTARDAANAKEPAMKPILKTALTLLMALTLPVLSSPTRAHEQDLHHSKTVIAQAALPELAGALRGGDYGV